MLKEILIDIFSDTWPTILLATVILVSLRVTYLIKSHKKVVIYKELFFLIFVIYALCLFHVVTYQDLNYGTNNFTPFKEILRYQFSSEKFFKNIIGNILLFVPYGFFSSYLLKNKKLSVAFILTAIVTLTIETLQYYIGRVFDVDDIILNICGGILGFIFYVGMEKIKLLLPKILRKDWVINLFVILVLLIVIIYSFDINLTTWFS